MTIFKRRMLSHGADSLEKIGENVSYFKNFVDPRQV